MSISSLHANTDAFHGAETLAATSLACVVDAIAYNAAADSLEQRQCSMINRTGDAVTTTVAYSGALLALSAEYAASTRLDADRIAKMSRKHLEDDVIFEAGANIKQLASWSAFSASLSCIDWSDFAYSAVLLGDELLFSSTTTAPLAVFCVASVQVDVDVMQLLHRICSRDIDITRSTVSGQGLTAFDPLASAAARQQNIIHVVPRDADGVIADWVTATDICLTLLPHGVDLSFDVDVCEEGWRVTYTVRGVSTAGSRISLQLDVCHVSTVAG